jgi:hypothetical protein
MEPLASSRCIILLDIFVDGGEHSGSELYNRVKLESKSALESTLGCDGRHRTRTRFV